MQLIKLFAGTASSGKQVLEELPVNKIGESVFQLLSTPGLVLGLARDDEINLDAEASTYKLVRRGGRVAVQVYSSGLNSEELHPLASQLAQMASATLDRLTPRQAVFSFPAASGFVQVERLLNLFVSSRAGTEWYYGNVYADDGVTPLNWWQALVNLSD